MSWRKKVTTFKRWVWLFGPQLDEFLLAYISIPPTRSLRFARLKTGSGSAAPTLLRDEVQRMRLNANPQGFSYRKWVSFGNNIVDAPRTQIGVAYLVFSTTAIFALVSRMTVELSRSGGRRDRLEQYIKRPQTVSSRRECTLYRVSTCQLVEKSATRALGQAR